jgi:elongation factor P
MQAGDIKKGKTFELEGAVYTVVDFQQVKQARSASFIRTKIKNVETGNVMEKKFNPTDKLTEAIIERRDMQYLYSDDNFYYFMDVETFEQNPVEYETVKEALKYIIEENVVEIHSYKGKIIAVETPMFVELNITKCDPWLQGDSSRAGNKPATVETGLELRVPIFVANGDRIKIDTRTGEYVERV